MVTFSTFTAASYNVLANAYVQHSLYRRTPKMVLDPSWRLPAVTHQVADIGTDAICLQEVEMDTFAALRNRLNSLGYEAEYALKRGGKPDGCAIFYRRDLFDLAGTRIIEYADGREGQPNSGHIGLLVLLRAGSHAIGIANTHLIWDPPGTPSGARLGYRQALQLLNECENLATACDGWLLCGDLNATPDSDIIRLFEKAGLRYSHAGVSETITCKVNAEAKMIDYLFYSQSLEAEPQDMVRISAEAVLPSAEHPSDHLPVISRFLWKM
jgi:protein angel